MNVKKAKTLRKQLGYKPHQKVSPLVPKAHNSFGDRKYEPLMIVSYGSSTVREVRRTLVNHSDSLRRLYRETKNELKAGNEGVRELVN